MPTKSELQEAVDVLTQKNGILSLDAVEKLATIEKLRGEVDYYVLLKKKYVEQNNTLREEVHQADRKNIELHLEIEAMERALSDREKRIQELESEKQALCNEILSLRASNAGYEFAVRTFKEDAVSKTQAELDLQGEIARLNNIIKELNSEEVPAEEAAAVSACAGNCPMCNTMNCERFNYEDVWPPTEAEEVQEVDPRYVTWSSLLHFYEEAQTFVREPDYVEQFFALLRRRAK